MQKIKTALLSYGMSGKIFQAPFLTLHEGFELVGCWERSKDVIRKDYPHVKSYRSFEELLADDIDLVVVNTPIDSHFSYAKKALKAGKHVLVEKAFTTSAWEAEELMKLAASKNLKLTVYQNRRWDSDFKTVQQVLKSGVLGEILEAEIRFDRYNPHLSPKQWKETATPGAGIMKDLGPHIIDQALCLFGFPEALFADIRYLRENTLIEDNMDVTLYYNDKRVRLHAGYFNKELQPGFILQGRNGSFFKPRADVQEDVLKTGAKPNLSNWGIEPKEKEGILHYIKNSTSLRERVTTLQGNYYDLFDGVYNAIAHNRTEPVTASDGLNIMRIIEAAFKSSEEKRVIKL